MRELNKAKKVKKLNKKTEDTWVGKADGYEKDEVLRASDIEKLFGVTTMTVFNWRSRLGYGIGRGLDRIAILLPFHEEVRPKRNLIYFVKYEVYEWAARCEIPFADGRYAVIDEDGNIRLKKKRVVVLTQEELEALSGNSTLSAKALAAKAASLLE